MSVVKTQYVGDNSNHTVTLNNTSDYIGWTNGLSDYRANGLGLGSGVR